MKIDLSNVSSIAIMDNDKKVNVLTGIPVHIGLSNNGV